jgi:hypothetical protein
MAPKNTTSTINNKEQQMALLPDEAETAATLLKIMAGAELSSIGGGCRASPFAQQPFVGTSHSFQSSTHQMAAAPEANQQNSFQKESSSPSQQQVPNPLQHLKTHSTRLQAATASNRHRSANSTTPKNENNNANKSSATVFAPPQTYNLSNANHNNFMISSPASTYSFLQSLIQQQQQQASLAAVAASMSNQYLPDLSSTTPNPLLLLAKNPLVPSSASRSISATKEQEPVDNDELIRREEVVKALHSKPQRGRKRRNLNEEERQELTRTRNREHAKSTRERKKQRHLELLDMERLYQEVKRQQDMQGQRREIVCRFVAARQAMLQQVLDHENSSPKEGTSVAALDVIDGLILSRGDLRHHIRGQRGGADLDGVTLMGLFDRSLAALLPAQGSEATYRYDVNAIALTQQGDAKLECSICFGGRAIKTMHMTVSFADGTAKIIAVDIAFLQDESSSSSERQHPSLGNQVSHPSVVSLDDRYGYSFSRSKTEDEDSQVG